MKANELRIGNILTDGKFEFSVESIERDMVWGDLLTCIKPDKIEDFYDEGVYHFNIENIEGIPLTEEWLLKFGFREIKYRNEEMIVYRKDVPSRRIYFDIIMGTHSIVFGTEFLCFAFYVHQLQNLYFALTGEELECKN